MTIGIGGPPFDVHAQLPRQAAQSSAERLFVQLAWMPGGLKSHAELPPGDLFLQCLYVGPLLKQQVRHMGHNAGLVLADDGDGRVAVHRAGN